VTAESDVNALAAQVTALKSEITNSKTALDHYKDLATERDATATTLNTAISGVRDEVEDIKDATNTAYQLSTTAAPVDDLAARSIFPTHNAVLDAFVYDTTKDSDGGAWRNRTQRTSWYDESDAATGKWLGTHASESDARNAYANLGSELVNLGDFSADTSDWVKPTGYSISGGTASYDGTGAQYAKFYQTLSTTSGKVYELTFTLSGLSGGTINFGFGNGSGTSFIIPQQTYSSNGTYTRYMVADATNNSVMVQNNTASQTFSIDNISVKEVTSQTTKAGDYFQLSTDGYFYKLNPSSGTTQVYRGSRKQFPAVAVIVIQEQELIIYDGDDPTLPMWMVFRRGTNRWLRLGTSGSRTLAAKNGIICAGSSSADLVVMNFIKEYNDFYAANYYTTDGDISQRNDGLGILFLGGATIIGREVNDVAMTVLPAAPIDPATGLPIPTIAVATDDGVSIIKDDGTIVDILNGDSSNNAKTVAFTSDNRIACQLFDDNRGFRLFDIPDADITQGNHYSQGYADEWYADNVYTQGNVVRLLGETSSGLTHQLKVATYQQNLYSGHLRGVSTVARNPSDQNKSMVNYTLPDYISGWMLGDIKFATLADTRTTALTGIDYAYGDWTTTGGFTLSGSNGSFTATNTTGNHSTARIPVKLLNLVGEYGIVTFTLTFAAGSTGFGVRFDSLDPNPAATSQDGT
jgi:hypothetical protein